MGTGVFSEGREINHSSHLVLKLRMSGVIFITPLIRLWTGKTFLTVNKLFTLNMTCFCILYEFHLFHHNNFTLQHPPRCTVWTVNPLHVAGLGALHGSIII
jgi:hypothetical protein